jgi:hypothetical protein
MSVRESNPALRGVGGLLLAASLLLGCTAEVAETENVDTATAELLIDHPTSIADFESVALAWPEYAGLWVEGAEEEAPVIYLARTSESFEPLARAQADAPIIYIDVQFSMQELNAAFEAVLESDEMDDSIAFGAYIDPRLNRIVLEPGLDADEVLTDPDVIAYRLGVASDMIVVEEPITVSTTALAGGYAAGGCTGGYPVKKAKSGGGYYYGLLTAGHCSDSAFTSASCTYYGASYGKVTATGIDRQIHRNKSGSCSLTRRLKNGVVYKSGYSSGYNGQSIRRLGKTTGTKSGTIYNNSWYYGGTDGPWTLSSTSLACAGGDSGGPWYTSASWPLGITRGVVSYSNGTKRCFASKISKALSGTGYGIY